MKLPIADLYVRGILISAVGMLVISPDGLFFRLIEDAGPWDIAFYRMLFSGVAISLLLVGLRGWGVVASLRGLGRIEAVSALLLSITNLSFVGAITHTSVANTLVLLATMPLFSAVLGWLLIGERVRPRTVLAILVAIGGIGVIVSGSGGFGAGTLLGDGLALMTACLLGLNLVVLRRVAEGAILPVVAVSGFISAGIAFFFADPSAVLMADLGIIALMALIVQCTGLVLFLTGTRFVPAAEVAILALVETVLGPLWAWIGVGEAPGARSLLGGAIVIGAIVLNAGLSLWQRHRRRPSGVND